MVFIQNPLRCFKCQKFDHSSKTCKSSITCSTCGQVGHTADSWQGQPKCSGSYPASSKELQSGYLKKKSSRLKRHVWPLTATLTKRLNAAHHRWQRSILGISWKDRESNKRRGQSQNWTSLQYGSHTQWKKTPLAWTCDTNGSPAHTLTGIALGCSAGFKRGPGRLRTNWRSTVNKDLLWMGITSGEAEVAAQNILEWHWSVAQCIHQGWGLEDCPQPRGQLEDKKLWPWPWPRKGLALPLKATGLGPGLSLEHAVLKSIPAWMWVESRSRSRLKHKRAYNS